MMEPLSPLEISLVRSSLGTRTDDELAELLERPVVEVTAYMDQLTGIGADERLSVITAARLKKEQEAKKKKFPIKSKPLTDKDIKAEKKRRERVQRMNVEEARVLERTRREGRQRLATKVVDYSKMKSVKVNRNTFVFVPLHVKDKDAIDLFYANADRYRKNFININK